ncbi:hypothetical protein JCM8547_003660 [Rhodosporidiobolus lusitaniae]
MHVSLEILGQSKNPRRRHYRTEAERKRAEEERREQWLRRAASFTAQMISPLVSLFSLPALTEHWYVKRENGFVVKSKDDPPLIVAAGSIALALGILANISILFRLIDTHSRFFTVSTMVILLVHITINTIALTIFGVRQSTVDDGYVLSTAYWLTTASSGVALGVVSLLLIDARFTKWYTINGTGLTGKQRSLIIAFDIFVALLMIGTVSFRYLVTDLNYLDALYFSIQSLITTGFGDITPDTTGAQVFAIFFNTVGIVAFAIVVAFVRATALEAMQEEYKSQERAVVDHLRDKRPSFISRLLTVASCGLYHSHAQQEEEQDEAEEDRQRRERRDSHRGEQEKDAAECEHIEYEEAIVELKRERNREFRSEAVVSLGLFLTMWLVGAAVFSRLEEWNYWTAVYFSYISFSSIGYGDYSPVTQGGRAFFCVWALFGAGVLTVFFSVIADAYSQRFSKSFPQTPIPRHRPLSTPSPSSATPWLVLRYKLFSPYFSFAEETFQHSFFRRLVAGISKAAHHKQDLDHAELQALPGPPSPTSSRQSLTVHPDEAVKRKKEEKPKEADIGHELIALLEDAREHLDHLIVSDGDAKTTHVDSVVRRLMDKENFDRRNREEVENDSNFKQFLYLRSLQAKLSKLEHLAQQALGDKKEGDSTEDGVEEVGKEGQDEGPSTRNRDIREQARDREEHSGNEQHGLGRD